MFLGYWGRYLHLQIQTPLVASCEAQHALSAQETAPELITTHLETIDPTFEEITYFDIGFIEGKYGIC